MKKLFIMVAILLATTVGYTQAHNEAVPKTAVLTTTVITPFSVVDFSDVVPNTEKSLPDVVIGQKRAIPHVLNADVVCLFEFTKEANYVVSLPEFYVSNTSTDGQLKITAHWMWHDEEPTTQSDLQGYPLNISGMFQWDNVQTKAWASMHVTEVNAESCSTIGTKIFTAKVTGYYSGL